MNFVNTEMACDTEEDFENAEHGTQQSEKVLGDTTILRSKGFFWLATRLSQSLLWSQAGECEYFMCVILLLTWYGVLLVE